MTDTKIILKGVDISIDFFVDLHSFTCVDINLVQHTYLSWLNDLEVIRLIASPALDGKRDISFIQESWTRFTSKSCIGFFIKYQDAFVGTAKIDYIDYHNKRAEIGIMIGERQLWGNGISYQVFAMLTDYCFTKMNMHKIWGGTVSANFAMDKTFLKLGFSKEAVLREQTLIDGIYYDSYLYGMLKKEYVGV